MNQQRGRELIQKGQRELESKKWWTLTNLCNLVAPLILTIRVKELAPQGLQPAKVDCALPFWLMYSGCFQGRGWRGGRMTKHFVFCHQMGSRCVLLCLYPPCSLNRNGCIVKHRTIQEGRDLGWSLVLSYSKPGQHWNQVRLLRAIIS